MNKLARVAGRKQGSGDKVEQTNGCTNIESRVGFCSGKHIFHENGSYLSFMDYENNAIN